MHEPKAKEPKVKTKKPPPFMLAKANPEHSVSWWHMNDIEHDGRVLVDDGVSGLYQKNGSRIMDEQKGAIRHLFGVG